MIASAASAITPMLKTVQEAALGRVVAVPSVVVVVVVVEVPVAIVEVTRIRTESKMFVVGFVNV